MKTTTKGNVIIEEIKVGDIHYEYHGNLCCKSTVLSLPVLKDNVYEWKSKHFKSGKYIDYAMSITYPDAYRMYLYTYEAYKGCVMV